MIFRSFLPIAAGLLLGGCCHQNHASATRPATTKSLASQYELPNRQSDPLANYGRGTSADIPDNPAVGSYPGPITPPISPLMGIGD